MLPQRGRARRRQGREPEGHDRDRARVAGLAGAPRAGKTCIKSTGYAAFGIGSHVAAVDVKDDRIIRIRPLPYDWKYRPEEFRPWKIEARGHTFEVPLKTTINPFGLGYKKSVYSPNRIPYPLKRVDWDPDGERNPQNRGKSGYVRISWDEALDIIVGELRRVIDTYGPCGRLRPGRRTRRVQGGAWDARLPVEAPGPPRRLHAAGAQRRQLGGLVLGGQALLGRRALRADAESHQHLPRHLEAQRPAAVLGLRPHDHHPGLQQRGLRRAASAPSGRTSASSRSTSART